MASFFTIILDTVAPGSPTLNLGGVYTANQLINTTVGTSDTPTTGYGMKFWGDIEVAWAKTNGLLLAGYSGGTPFLETDAQYITFATNPQLKLSAGDGSKSISMRIRDKVWNESSIVTQSISLDGTLPTVTIVGGGADVNEISSNTAKNTANFSFNSSENFTQFKVCVVNVDSATESQGTVIPTTNGSTNTSNTGSYTSGTNYNVVLKGADVLLASAGTGAKIIKVFVRDSSGQWSA